MRAGLTSSVVLHTIVLGWGIFRLSAPEAFNVDDVESLPVELVSIAELTQVQHGAEEAKKDGPAAPLPTEKPPVEPEAENIGDKERDQAAPETEEQKAVEVDQAVMPKPSEAPVPEPAPRPEPVEEATPDPKPEPVPTTEMASLPQPEQEVAPDPTEEAAVASDPVPAAEPEKVLTPDRVPLPAVRPERPKAQTAKTDDRKKAEPKKQATATPRAPDSESLEDEVAALLNQEKASGGGAQRSNQQASLGEKRTTGGSELTQSEMDALRSQIQQCWNPPAALGAGELKVSVRFQLDQNGRLEGRPAVSSTSGNRAADDSAIRAIQMCEQRNQGYRLPVEKYDAWRDVVVNFDPSDMFR